MSLDKSGYLWLHQQGAAHQHLSECVCAASMDGFVRVVVSAAALWPNRQAGNPSWQLEIFLSMDVLFV